MNKFNLTILLSYDFSHNISVDLFHDKKNVVIALIYFLVFLWDLFVMDLELSGEDLIKIAEGHMRSTCWKVNNLARCPAQYSLSRKVTHDLDLQLALVVSDPRCTPILLKIVTFLFLFTHTIYTLITHIN